VDWVHKGLPYFGKNSSKPFQSRVTLY